MSISPDTVRHVAALARLRFSDEALEPFTRQLNDILEYFATLQEVDTTGVEPLAHAVELTNAFRADEAHDSLPADEALENAPDREQTCFRVPRIIEV